MALTKCHECKSEISTTAVACPKCGAKPKPKTSFLTWLIGGIVLFAIIGNIANKDRGAGGASASSGSTSQSANSDYKAITQQASAAEEKRTAEGCRSAYDAQKQSYSALMQSGKPWEAATAIRLCSTALNDVELKGMVSKAEHDSYLHDLKSQKTTSKEKVQALDLLTRDFPEEAKQYESSRPALVAKLDAEAAAEGRRASVAETARRKKEGVSIGMSMDEVRASNWGRPRKVNRSTYTFGVHEQWVYDGGYLYFEDGKLTSIQN